MKLDDLFEQQRAFESTLRGALHGIMQGDMAPWIDMFADDGAMEFPFGPPGYPARIAGKAALEEYLRDYPKRLKIETLADFAVRQTLDPETAVVEFAVEGRVLATGRPYAMRYVGVVTLRDGKVANYRDYWNPLVALQALGGDAALKSAFGVAEP